MIKSLAPTMAIALAFTALAFLISSETLNAQEQWWKPYTAPRTTRQTTYAFTSKPKTRSLGNDKYEITFAVKGFCDATVSIVNPKGKIVRHLASGVLGANAPPPFQKNSLLQKLLWDGKNDIGQYEKHPEALQIKVALGLKPTFEKTLGHHNDDVHGSYRAIGFDKNGAYVLSGEYTQLKHFDHDGRYQRTVFPPAPDVPLEQFKGMRSLEIEPGKKVLHNNLEHHAGFTKPVAPVAFTSTVSGRASFLPPGGTPSVQVPQIQNGWFIYANTGNRHGNVYLYKIWLKDGSSNGKGFLWKQLSRNLDSPGYFKEFSTSILQTAVSPDGKTIYLAGLSSGRPAQSIYRLNLTKDKALGKKPFVGDDRKVGSDNKHFNFPQGIACDSNGRVYVCDTINNRIQVYSPEAKLLKSIKITKPLFLHIHPKTDALYLVHQPSVKGRSVNRLTKLKSFSTPTPIAHLDWKGPPKRNFAPVIALDPYTKSPRIWLTRPGNRLQIWEDQGSSFGLIKDFKESVKKSKTVPGAMNARFAKLIADPTNDHLYFYGGASSGWGIGLQYDIKTGGAKSYRYPGVQGDFGPDHAFDKRGYLFTHTLGLVERHDPKIIETRHTATHQPYKTPIQVPFDYGTTGRSHGAIALKDQPGAKCFQDGIGVNMQGDVAVVSNIYHVPKFGKDAISAIINDRSYDGSSQSARVYKKLQERIRNGEDVYAVKRWPGRKLAGGTIWVFDRTGELRDEDAVPGLGLVNGVQIDDVGALYLAFNSPRRIAGKTFLTGRGKVIGEPKTRVGNPFTGTFMKVPATGAKVYSKMAQVGMDPWPSRANDTSNSGWKNKDPDGWVEGADWLYAGVSPIVPDPSCSCPSVRHSTDWFKRSYVPEVYRRSIGILDANGNLIMHLGRYGNADTTSHKDGEPGFAFFQYISTTDQYLCVSDTGNSRIVVLKLDYHAKESCKIDGGEVAISK